MKNYKSGKLYANVTKYFYNFIEVKNEIIFCPPPIKTSLIFTLLAACQLSSISVAQEFNGGTYDAGIDITAERAMNTDTDPNGILSYSGYEHSLISTTNPNHYQFQLTNHFAGLSVEDNKFNLTKVTADSITGSIYLLEGYAVGDASVQNNELKVSDSAFTSLRTAFLTLGDPSRAAIVFGAQSPEQYQATVSNNKSIIDKSSGYEQYTAFIEIKQKPALWSLTANENSAVIRGKSNINQVEGVATYLKSETATQGSVSMERNSVSI